MSSIEVARSACVTACELKELKMVFNTQEMHPFGSAVYSQAVIGNLNSNVENELKLLSTLKCDNLRTHPAN